MSEAACRGGRGSLNVINYETALGHTSFLVLIDVLGRPIGSCVLLAISLDHIYIVSRFKQIPRVALLFDLLNVYTKLALFGARAHIMWPCRHLPRWSRDADAVCKPSWRWRMRRRHVLQLMVRCTNEEVDEMVTSTIA